jgi:hypothetical protein
VEEGAQGEEVFFAGCDAVDEEGVLRGGKGREGGRVNDGEEGREGGREGGRDVP